MWLPVGRKLGSLAWPTLCLLQDTDVVTRMKPDWETTGPTKTGWVPQGRQDDELDPTMTSPWV